jgi:hypothetical protein
MWLLLKSLSQYCGFVVIAGLTVVGIVTVFFLVLGGSDFDKSVPAYRSVLMAATALVWLYSVLMLHKEKIDRFHILLPISVRQIGVVRVILLIGFWTTILLVFILSNVVVGNLQNNPALIWNALSLTGFVLVVNSVPYLQRDLANIFTSKGQRFVLSVVWVILVMIGYVLFVLLVMPVESFGSLDVAKEFITMNIITPGGAFLFFLLGLGLTILTIVLFGKRQLYIE